MLSRPDVRAREENAFIDLSRCHLRTVDRRVDIEKSDKRWFMGIPYWIEKEMVTEGKHEDR